MVPGGAGHHDVTFTGTFVGGHLEKGHNQDNSEHARLLRAMYSHVYVYAGLCIAMEGYV